MLPLRPSGHLLQQGLLDNEEPADPIGQRGQVRQKRVRVEIVDISASNGRAGMGTFGRGGEAKLKQKCLARSVKNKTAIDCDYDNDAFLSGDACHGQ